MRKEAVVTYDMGEAKKGKKNKTDIMAKIQARANAAGNKPKGKLGAQLQEQKKQTRNDTLEAVSAEERAHRQIKANEQTQRYD